MVRVFWPFVTDMPSTFRSALLSDPVLVAVCCYYISNKLHGFYLQHAYLARVYSQRFSICYNCQTSPEWYDLPRWQLQYWQLFCADCIVNSDNRDVRKNIHFPLLMFPTILINSLSPFDPLVSWWKNWRGSDLSPGSKSLSRSRGCCNSSSILASWDVISAVWIRCWSLTTWITPWVSWSPSWRWCSRPDCAFWCE